MDRPSHRPYLFDQCREVVKTLIPAEPAEIAAAKAALATALRGPEPRAVVKHGVIMDVPAAASQGLPYVKGVVGNMGTHVAGPLEGAGDILLKRVTDPSESAHLPDDLHVQVRLLANVEKERGERPAVGIEDIESRKFVRQAIGNEESDVEVDDPGVPDTALRERTLHASLDVGESNDGAVLGHVTRLPGSGENSHGHRVRYEHDGCLAAVGQGSGERRCSDPMAPACMTAN